MEKFFKVGEKEYMVDCWFSKGRGAIIAMVEIEKRDEFCHSYNPMEMKTLTVKEMSRDNKKKIAEIQSYVSSQGQMVAEAFVKGKDSLNEKIAEIRVFLA